MCNNNWGHNLRESTGSPSQISPPVSSRAHILLNKTLNWSPSWHRPRGNPQFSCQQLQCGSWAGCHPTSCSSTAGQELLSMPHSSQGQVWKRKTCRDLPGTQSHTHPICNALVGDLHIPHLLWSSSFPQVSRMCSVQLSTTWKKNASATFFNGYEHRISSSRRWLMNTKI